MDNKFTAKAVEAVGDFGGTCFNIVDIYRQTPGALLLQLQSMTAATLSQDDADLALSMVTALLARKADANLQDVFDALRAEASLVGFANTMGKACPPGFTTRQANFLQFSTAKRHVKQSFKGE